MHNFNYENNILDILQNRSKVNNNYNNFLDVSFIYSSVIRQKSESQNGCFKKTNGSKFFEKQTFLTL